MCVEVVGEEFPYLGPKVPWGPVSAHSSFRKFSVIMAPPAAERPVLHTRKVVDSLVRMLDQQAHVAEMVSAQASSLAALPAWEVQQPETAQASS